MAAYLADAAALARAQWTQFSPGAMLAGLGLFAVALLLHLRFAWAAAAHGSTLWRAAAPGLGRRTNAGLTQSAAPAACQAAESMQLTAGAVPAQQQPLLHTRLRKHHAADGARTAHVRSTLIRASARLSGIESAALAAVLACGAAVFSANAVMAEGAFVTGVLVLLTLALALHRPPAPIPPTLPHSLQPTALANPHASLQKPNRTLTDAGRAWPAAGVVLMAAAAATLGIVPRTPTDAMHKAAAAAPGAAWLRLAAPAARACAPFYTLCPALRAGLRAAPCAAALAMLLRLQARFDGRERRAAGAWSARRFMRGAARSALAAAYACAALHMTLAGDPPAGQRGACAGPPPAPAASLQPAVLLRLAASLRAAVSAALRPPASGAAGACQDMNIGLLMPRLVYAFSAAAAALCLCHACLADTRMAAAPLPEQDLDPPGSVHVAKTPESGPCHKGAAAGFLLSGVSAALLAPAMVVLGPGRTLTVALGLAECACAWTLICGGSTGAPGRGRAGAAGVLWALLGTHLFFCTGHFCEFAGLQTAAGAMRHASWPPSKMRSAVHKCMQLSTALPHCLM